MYPPRVSSMPGRSTRLLLSLSEHKEVGFCFVACLAKPVFSFPRNVNIGLTAEMDETGRVFKQNSL